MKNIILIVVLSVLTNLAFAGGPWPQPKGKAFVKLSEWWTIFDQHYTDSGQIDPNLTSGIFNTSIYVEYGVTDRFTAILNAPLYSRAYNNNLRSGTNNNIIIEGEAINSIGDIDLALKYSLTGQNAIVPIAISLTLGIPSGKVGGGSLGNLQTGDGEFNQYIKADIGRGFNLGKTSGYVSFYGGINNRTENFSDEVRVGAELGLGLANQKFWLTGRLDILESLNNGATASESINSTSIFSNNTEFVSLGVEANYYVTKRVGVSAGITSAVSGRVIAAAPSYSVGVFYDMSK